MKAIKISLLILVVSSLSACSWSPFKDDTVVVNNVLSLDCGTPPKAGPISLLPTEPTIIEDKFGIKWVAFTFRHYEHMGKNFSQAKAHIKQRVAIQNFWTDCIDKHNEQAEVKNGEDSGS